MLKYLNILIFTNPPSYVKLITRKWITETVFHNCTKESEGYVVTSKKNYYSIGEMAHLCDISPKTLRYYDQIDLIKPSYKSKETGYRYYSKEQEFTIYTIKQLQHLEFSLKEIKTLIQRDSEDLYEQAIGSRLSFLDQQIETLTNTRNEGSILLNRLHNNTSCNHAASDEKKNRHCRE